MAWTRARPLKPKAMSGISQPSHNSFRAKRPVRKGAPEWLRVRGSTVSIHRLLQRDPPCARPRREYAEGVEKQLGPLWSLPSVKDLDRRHVLDRLGDIAASAVDAARCRGAKRRNGAPGTIRTPAPQIRSLMLYPAELRAHAPAMSRSAITIFHRLARRPPSGARPSRTRDAA